MGRVTKPNPRAGRSQRQLANTDRGRVVAAAFVALALGTTACSSDDDPAPTEGGLPENAADAVQTYAQIASASYDDSLTAATALDGALQSLLAGPTTATMDGAKNAWLASREPYLQTEVYRFYDGPIDGPVDGPEGLLNAWPLDEAYVDYVEGDPMAGIINDSTVTIDAAMLESLNEQGGEENIATGFHAIEFLLWGQDMSETGPGERPATDFVTDGSGTADNQDRRGDYLTTVSTMLLGHLGRVVDAWKSGSSGNYRSELEAVEPSEALRRILTGMIVLSGFETGGERLQTALDSGDQEDEHSCFSDNTHRDMIQDVQGVSNVWRGTYVRLDGTTVMGVGIGEVVRAVDANLASQLDAQIAASLAAANALQTPFDQEIALGNAEGHARVQALIDALRAQEGLLEDVFRLFELTIPEPE